MTESDEEFGLVKRALYVPGVFYDIQPSQTPTTAAEYIYMQRCETIGNEISEDSNRNETLSPRTSFDSSEVECSTQWEKSQAKEFSEIRMRFSNLLKLKRKNEKTLFDIDDERDCCIFCLGSEASNLIRSEKVSGSEAKDGQKPLLSILLQLTPTHVDVLLMYSVTWLKFLGPSTSVCHWIYALLTCISKPLSLKSIDTLTKLKACCKELSSKCCVLNRENGAALNLFLILLKYYFEVK